MSNASVLSDTQSAANVTLNKHIIQSSPKTLEMQGQFTCVC